MPSVAQRVRLRPFRLVFLGAALVASLPTLALAKLPAAGKPSFKAGDPEAFWVWHDAAGWHLRATTGKKQHAFRGVLRAKGLGGLVVTRPALSTKVTASADAIRFDYDLFAGGLDGFDWKAGERCITIELRVDTKPQPELVHVGASGASPTIFPSDICE